MVNSELLYDFTTICSYYRMSVVLQASRLTFTEEVIVESNKSYDDVLAIIEKEASFYLIRGDSINVHNIALGSIWEIYQIMELYSDRFEQATFV